MKNIFLITGVILLLSGCGQHVQNQEAEQSLLAKSANRSSEAAQVKDATVSKTRFSFSPSQTAFLEPDASQTITVRATPQHDPVFTISVQLKYDPQKITVSNVIPHNSISSLEASVDPESGIIRFVGTSTDGIFGSNIPLFSFDSSPASVSVKGESTLRFSADSTHALLSDVNNTDTVDTETLPFLVFSLL